MPTYKKGAISIHYEEVGSGFPLLVIAGGGLNSTIASLSKMSPFNPMVDFKDEYRCIAADLRNAVEGQSSGPLEADRPWDAYADDQLGVMDHLGIDKFMSECRALTNLVGNGVACVVVSRWEGELDTEKLRQVMAHPVSIGTDISDHAPEMESSATAAAASPVPAAVR